VKLSRSRQTTDPQGRFVTPRLTLILRTIGPSLAPAHFPTPLRAGARSYFDESPVPGW
jgi:hypothetical protein